MIRKYYIRTGNEISADDFYRPDDSELYKQPDVEITKWSGPYFNEEQQRGAFRNLLRVDGGSRHQRPQAADAAKRTTTDPLSMSDFDPNKLFNPSMIQRPRPRHVKQQGPEAETFIGWLYQIQQNLHAIVNNSKDEYVFHLGNLGI